MDLHDVRPLLTVRQAAALIGINPTTCRRLIRLGRLGHVRVGVLIRIPPRDLDQFIVARYQAPRDPR